MNANRMPLLVGAVGVAVGLTACGQSSTHDSSLVTSHAPHAAVAVTAATPAAEAQPALSGGLLTHRFTYDHGMLDFQPPAGGMRPTVSRDDAVAAFMATGLYSGPISGAKPQVFLAAYTNHGAGTDDAHGHLVLSTSNRPVWVVRYVNIPDSPGGSSQDGAATVLHDIIALVDARSGQVLEVDSDLPDAHAMDAPAPVASPYKPGH